MIKQDQLSLRSAIYPSLWLAQHSPLLRTGWQLTVLFHLRLILIYHLALTPRHHQLPTQPTSTWHARIAPLSIAKPAIPQVFVQLAIKPEMAMMQLSISVDSSSAKAQVSVWTHVGPITSILPIFVYNAPHLVLAVWTAPPQVVPLALLQLS